MATGKELDELVQYHNKENQDDKVEKYNCTTGTESSMRQMPMTTEMTTLHRTSPLAWHCTLSTLTSTSTESAHHERAQSCSLCTFHHTHIWLKFEPFLHSTNTNDHHHGHPCGCCLFDMTSSFLSLRLPPVCLPLHLLPLQRRAAAGAQQEVHGKPALLRDQRV